MGAVVRVTGLQQIRLMFLLFILFHVVGLYKVYIFML